MDLLAAVGADQSGEVGLHIGICENADILRRGAQGIARDGRGGGVDLSPGRRGGAEQAKGQNKGNRAAHVHHILGVSYADKTNQPPQFLHIRPDLSSVTGRSW